VLNQQAHGLLGLQVQGNGIVWNPTYAILDSPLDSRQWLAPIATRHENYHLQEQMNNEENMRSLQ
jgi:hypothetical protein